MCAFVAHLIFNLKTTLPGVFPCSSEAVASLVSPLSSLPPSLTSHLCSLFLLIMREEKSPTPLLLLLLHLGFVFVQQCHTDSSVLCLPQVLYNEFGLGRESGHSAIWPLLWGQEGAGGMNKRRKKRQHG